VYGSIRLWLALGSVLLPGLAQAGSEGASRARILERYGELPLAFEPNQGQFSRQVRFSTRGPATPCS
jgi:hypothetical protein